MTYAGARGHTAAEMKTVLHFALENKKLHPAMGALAKSLSAKKEGLKLSIANALWGQKGYGFLKEFLDLNRKNYEAGLSELDFITATEEARKTINSWVEKKTNNKIKDLLKKGSVPKDTRLILTNAIYFKGTWKYQFKKKDTKKEKFHLSKQKSTLAYMMRMKKPELKYMYDGGRVRGEGFAALELPYKGEEVSMVIFLPDRVDGLGVLEAKLTRDNLKRFRARQDASGNGHAHRVQVSRGRFLRHDRQERPLHRRGYSQGIRGCERGRHRGGCRDRGGYEDRRSRKAHSVYSRPPVRIHYPRQQERRYPLHGPRRQPLISAAHCGRF
jgi:serine protease inhibitor